MILSGSRVRWDSVQRTYRAHESVGILFHTLQPVGEKVAFAPPDSCVFIQIPMVLGLLGPPSCLIEVHMGEFRTPAAAALRAVTAGAPAAAAAAGRLGDGPGAGGPQLQEAR